MNFCQFFVVCLSSYILCFNLLDFALHSTLPSQPHSLLLGSPGSRRARPLVVEIQTQKSAASLRTQREHGVQTYFGSHWTGRRYAPAGTVGAAWTMDETDGYNFIPSIVYFKIMTREIRYFACSI